MKEDKQYLNHLCNAIRENDDDRAFAKLFKLLYKRLVSFSLNYVHSRALAEEAVSDVFYKFWTNRHSIINIQDVESYLYIAVKNQSLNYLKSNSHSFIQISESEELNISSFVEAFDPEKELEMRELIHHINIAVDTLPTQCKAVFRLIKEDGFKYKQVAQILNISPRTVETQLMRALKRLDIALTIFVNKRKSVQKLSRKGLSNVRNFLLSLL